MHRSDTLTKLKPLRSRTDPTDTEPARSRNPRRKPLPALKTSSKTKGTHSYRQAAKDTVQSALELRPPITFEHLLRRDRKSPAHSQRNSLEEKETGIESAREQSRQLRKHVGSNAVHRIVEHNQQREIELKQALQQVEEQGTHYTRQLDETYYTLLERGEALRQTVRNLQGLVEDSRTFREQFGADASDLERAMTKDTESYHNFDEQEQSIRDMLAKLDKSKDRSTSLNNRLDAARKRVEACEQRVITAQKQRRKRWQVIWAVSGIILSILLGIWIFRKNAELNARLQFEDLLDAIPNASTDILWRPRPLQDPYLDDLFDGIS